MTITAALPTPPSLLSLLGAGHQQSLSSPNAWLREVVAHVRHLAGEGELPLFVWSLGLPQPMLLRLLDECSLASADVDGLDDEAYARIEKLTPASFHRLRMLLFQHRTRLIDAIHADYLSRAVAGACFGSRPLWEDLGLVEEKSLASFLATFYAPLVQKHRHCRHWKRQLFMALQDAASDGFSLPELLLRCVLQRQ